MNFRMHRYRFEQLNCLSVGQNYGRHERPQMSQEREKAGSREKPPGDLGGRRMKIQNVLSGCARRQTKNPNPKTKNWGLFDPPEGKTNMKMKRGGVRVLGVRVWEFGGLALSKQEPRTGQGSVECR